MEQLILRWQISQNCTLGGKWQWRNSKGAKSLEKIWRSLRVSAKKTEIRRLMGDANLLKIPKEFR